MAIHRTKSASYHSYSKELKNYCLYCGIDLIGDEITEHECKQKD